MSLLVAALWVAIGFLVLRYAGARFVFHEPRRADIAALAVVVAFVLGAYWPLTNHAASGGLSESPAPAAPAAAPPPVVPAPAAQGASAASPALAAPARVADVSNRCKTAALHSQAPANGFFDSLSDPQSPPQDIPRRADVGAEVYVVRGWATNRQGTGPAKSACLVIDGHIEPRALSFLGFPRADVAAALHLPGLANSGYAIVLGPSAVSRTGHRIQVAAEASDGSFSLLHGIWDVSPSGSVSQEH